MIRRICGNLPTRPEYDECYIAPASTKFNGIFVDKECMGYPKKSYKHRFCWVDSTGEYPMPDIPRFFSCSWFLVECSCENSGNHWLHQDLILYDEGTITRYSLCKKKVVWEIHVAKEKVECFELYYSHVAFYDSTRFVVTSQIEYAALESLDLYDTATGQFSEHLVNVSSRWQYAGNFCNNLLFLVPDNSVCGCECEDCDQCADRGCCDGPQCSDFEYCDCVRKRDRSVYMWYNYVGNDEYKPEEVECGLNSFDKEERFVQHIFPQTPYFPYLFYGDIEIHNSTDPDFRFKIPDTDGVIDNYPELGACRGCPYFLVDHMHGVLYKLEVDLEPGDTKPALHT